MSNLPIELDDTPERQHDCQEREMVAIESPVNTIDSNVPGSSQGYQIYRCKECSDIWGLRYQYDAGTGSDDSWHRYGDIDPQTAKRHY